ncbi:MAG: DciA family protein [Limnohabitans sp.]|nr:DciA family protein [Limnohabitans sp.]
MAKRTNRTRETAAPETTPIDPRLAWMNRIRQYRGRREPDVTVDRVLGALERDFAQRRRELGDVVDVWNDLVPRNARNMASVGGVAQGTLTVVVETSGAMYEVSRLLRDGLERALVDRLPGRVRRVKVKVGGQHSA